MRCICGASLFYQTKKETHTMGNIIILASVAFAFASLVIATPFVVAQQVAQSFKK